MALDWLKSRRNQASYAKAIEQLQEQLKKRRSDPRLQLQLAEVFIQANRKKEAVPLLEAVADEFALDGFAARAIAILKRIRAIDPENTQAEEKLAYLISQQDNPAPSPWRARPDERPGGLDIGMEEISDDDHAIGMEPIDDGTPAAARRRSPSPTRSGKRLRRRPRPPLPRRRPLPPRRPPPPKCPPSPSDSISPTTACATSSSS
jgi:Tetratricopeptide repeat